MSIPPRLLSALFFVFASAHSATADSAPAEQEGAAVTIWRDGRPFLRTASIQTAVDQALAGDELRVTPGVHHENVRIVGRSGRADAPIVLSAESGTEVVIDGADPVLQSPGSSRWQRLDDGTGWEAEVPWFGKTSRAMLTWASHADERLIAAHHNEDFFRAGRRGDALFRVGSRVKIRLADGRDPNYVALNIGLAEGILQFENSSHWIVRGLELRHAGYAGVQLKGRGVHDILVENVTVRTAFRGITTEEGLEGSRNIRIKACRVLNDWNFEWEWRLGYSDAIADNSDEAAPMRGTGIRIIADDSEVTRCEIAGQWDGIGVQGRNVRVSHNLVHHIADDMVELESNRSQNLWFHDNVGFLVYVGISVVSNQPGPLYIFRNRVSCTKRSRIEGADYRFGYPLKFGQDWGPSASQLYIYHNTFESGARGVFVQAKSAYAKWRDISFINNVFWRRDVKGPVGLEAMGSAANGVTWAGNLFSDPREPAKLLSLDPLFSNAGLVADPGFLTLSTPVPDYRPSPSSAVKGAALSLPAERGWPDSVPASAGTAMPDIGAVPFGSAPAAAGPGGDLHWPWDRATLH